MIGVISDKLRVRKPLMIVGGVAAAIMMVLYLQQAGHHASYYHLAVLLAALSFSLGVAYTPWMASFTETVEARNPALTATGLAIWGWVIRVTVFLATISIPAVISSVTPLVNYGGQAQAYEAAIPGLVPALTYAQENPKVVAFAQANQAQLAGLQKYSAQLTAAQKLGPELAAIAKDPAPFLKLQANPADTAAQAAAVQDLGGGAQGVAALQTIAANSAVITQIITNQATLQSLGAFFAANTANIAAVSAHASQLTLLASHPDAVKFFVAHGGALTKAAGDAPNQWKNWYWICFAGMIFFLGCVPLMKGRWSPKAAKADEEAHEAMVQAEMAKLGV